MHCRKCDYVWPDMMVYCPFCGMQLRSGAVEPDTDVLALDMTKVSLADLYPYIGMAEGWPSKLVAARKVMNILLRRAAGKPMWTPVYTGDRITYHHLDSEAMPAHIRSSIARRCKEMAVLGFTHLGDIVTPQHIAAPYIMVFTNLDANCGGQVSMWRPCDAGGVDGSLLETMFSAGLSVVTSSVPMPRHALAPWADCRYSPRLPTDRLFEIHQERLKALGNKHGPPSLWSNMDEFVDLAGGELDRWMQWSLESGHFARMKACQCG